MSGEQPQQNPNPANEKIGKLVGMLLFIVRGLRDGTVRSKPIMNIEPDAENYGLTSLEQEIWRTLNACGIKEVKPAETPAPAKKKGKRQS